MKTDDKVLIAVIKWVFILRHWRMYRYWKAKVRGDKVDDWRRGPGYYIVFGLFGHDPYKKIWKTRMESGKVGIYNLARYDTYNDPPDMIRVSWWNFVGYEGFKPIHECGFYEFIDLYGRYCKIPPKQAL